MNDRTESWKKRDEETEKAYAAFKVYLELGTDRSLAKAQKALGKPSGYTRWLETWSSKYDWVKRAAAWEAHLRRLDRARAEKEHLDKLEAHRSRQEKHAAAMLQSSSEALSSIQERISELESEEIADVTQLSKLIKACVELFRAATDAEAQALAVDELMHLIVHGEER